MSTNKAAAAQRPPARTHRPGETAPAPMRSLARQDIDKAYQSGNQTPITPVTPQPTLQTGRGEKGEKGERGEAGERGPKGDTGAAGQDLTAGAVVRKGEDYTVLAGDSWIIVTVPSSTTGPGGPA